MIRIHSMDKIRVVSVLAVLSIHISTINMTYNDYSYVWNQVSRFAVPLFILMSGFLLHYAELGRADFSTGRFYHKRLGKILFPYVLWTIIYTLYSARHLLLVEASTAPFPVIFEQVIRHLINGQGFVHLYFLCALFQLYLLYPLLHKWVMERPQRLMVISFILTASLHTLVYLHQTQYLVLPSLKITTYVSIFPSWILFFVLGMVLARNWASVERVLKGNFIYVALLWILVGVILVIDGMETGTFSSSIKPTVILYCIASFFFFYSLFLDWGIRGKLVETCFTWFAERSFMVYLVHPMLMNVSWIVLDRASLQHHFTTTVGVILYFIYITLGSLLIAHIHMLLKQSRLTAVKRVAGWFG